MDFYDVLVSLSLFLKIEKQSRWRKKIQKRDKFCGIIKALEHRNGWTGERKGHRETRSKTGNKRKQVSSIHLWVSHLSLTFYTEQTNSGASGCLPDGGQGVTGVRSQEAEEGADFKVLWCLQDKGDPQSDGVACRHPRIVPTTLDVKSLVFPWKVLRMKLNCEPSF